MGLYISVYIYLFLFALFQMGKAKKRTIFYAYVFICMVLFFISGFRYDLETDYWHYYRIFHNITKETLEPAFGLIIYLVKTLTNNYNIFLIIIAALSIGIKAKVFKSINYYFIALFVYYLRFFVLFDLNAIRQGVGIIFVILAVYYLLDDHYKKFVLLVVIATMFHSSSFFAFSILLFRKKNISLKSLTVLIIFAIFFRENALDFILNSFQALSNLMFSSNRLISGIKYIVNAQNTEVMSLIPLVRIIIPAYCFYFLSKTDKQKQLFNIFTAGALLNIMFFGYDTISFRLASVFYCVEGLLLGYSVESNKVTNLRKINLKSFVCFIIIILFDSVSFFNTLTTSESLIPFRTFIGR